MEFARRMSLRVGSIVKHFKRETVDLEKFPDAYLYRIIAFATHTETKEPLVIYESLYSTKGMPGIEQEIPKGHVCARPTAMFYSEVDKGKYPEIKQKYRFELFEGDFVEEVHTSEISDFYEKQYKEKGLC